MDHSQDPETPPSLERFGNYLLLKRLAQGGMAEVLLARPAVVAANGRIIVVKRMLVIAGESLVSHEMFQTEIRICSCLNHPNIVNVFDFGEVDSQPYLAMEHVQGWTLRAIAKRFAAYKRPVPIPLSVLIVSQAASALHYAHTFQDPTTGKPLTIIHRDVSPQNIMVSYSGNVKVIDFGIAKTAIDTARTETGVIKGKVSYLSPEQANQGPLSPATDVFSLGLILWELLTGKKLFDPNQAGSELAVLERVLEYTGLGFPPSALNPGVPPELDRVVAKALHPNPRERHASAAVLRRELHEVLVAKYGGFSTVEASETLTPLFAESIAKDQVALRQLNQLAQERLEQEEKDSAQPKRAVRERERTFSFVDLPELSSRVNERVEPLIEPVFGSGPPPQLATDPSALKPVPRPRAVREISFESGASEVKVTLAPRPQLRPTQKRPQPAYHESPGVLMPVERESFRERLPRLIERRWASILFAFTIVGALAFSHFGAHHADEKPTERAPADTEIHPIAARTATLRLLIEPYRYSALARVYVNDEEVLPEGDSIKVPLDQKIAIRIERPAFFPYFNEFTLDSAQVKPPGIFKLHVNLVAKPDNRRRSG